MIIQKTALRIISAILIVLFLLTEVLPIQIVKTVSKTAVQSARLLQFTAGGHALGFTSNGVYAATGSHVLHVDFVGANCSGPQKLDKKGVLLRGG
jgi:hypothetical protein